MLTAATTVKMLCCLFLSISISLCVCLCVGLFPSFFSFVLFWLLQWLRWWHSHNVAKKMERKHYFLMLSNLFITFHNRRGSHVYLYAMYNNTVIIFNNKIIRIQKWNQKHTIVLCGQRQRFPFFGTVNLFKSTFSSHRVNILKLPLPFKIPTRITTTILWITDFASRLNGGIINIKSRIKLIENHLSQQFHVNKLIFHPSFHTNKFDCKIFN